MTKGDRDRLLCWRSLESGIFKKAPSAPFKTKWLTESKRKWKRRRTDEKAAEPAECMTAQPKRAGEDRVTGCSWTPERLEGRKMIRFGDGGRMRDPAWEVSPVAYYLGILEMYRDIDSTTREFFLAN